MSNLSNLKDTNGIKIKTGDIVEITGAYFKHDNGRWLVTHSPEDKDWLGIDHCLEKLNKNGTLSKGKYKTSFWPLMTFVNDSAKRAEAKRHNAKYAKIEVVS